MQTTPDLTIAPSMGATTSRREFLGAVGTFTLGLTLHGTATRLEAAVQQGAPLASESATGEAVNSWLTVASDNSITLTIGASDMGQGSVQALGQILAEDLMVDPMRVRLVQGGPTMANPAPLGTSINTVGSSVTRRNYWRLRDAGAVARETLVMAAMNALGDGDRSHFTVSDGVVLHRGGMRLTYGQLAAAAARITPPSSAPLVPDAALRSIGKPLQRQDIPAKVDGSAVYGLDVRLPGMVFAAVQHCATFGGTLAATPRKPAGALAVVPLTVAAGTARGAVQVGQANAVAVVAGTTWDAMRAARSLRVSWSLPASAAQWHTAQFTAEALALLDHATPYSANGPNPHGTVHTVELSTADPEAAFTRPGTRVFEAVYQLPFVAHACMEVLNCTVDHVPGVRCDVYAPTQSARNALAITMALTGLAESQVRIHTTLLGGGLGRKAEVDFIAQAVQLGMVLNRPVQLMYPREEDFTHDQFRPMAVVRVRAAQDRTGWVSGWLYRNVSPSILGQRGSALGARGDSQGYEASQDLPYDFGARRVEWVNQPSPVPVGFWRSVGASINTFAVEAAVSELAAAAGQDALSFRRARLKDPRWLAVLDAVATQAGGLSAPVGRARGVAIGAAFDSVVAMVVEVSGSSLSSFKVTRVWLAIDCTLAVNPLNIEAQLVGGVVHGLNAALYGQQTFVNGAAQRRNFDRNPMIRLKQMPQVQVVILPGPVADRAAPIGGVGELGVPTLAPALAGALHKLTGQPVRSLPVWPNATMGG